MKCSKCKGTGQLPDPNIFRIPLWTGWERKGSISFVALEDAGRSDQVRKIGQDFAKFIKAHAHGSFHDGLCAELNRN